MDKVNLKEQLQLDIKKLVRELKDEEEILEIFKRRLTKKELKFYKLRIQDASESALCDELRCDNQRLEDIKKQTITKLNQEKIKNEIMV